MKRIFIFLIAIMVLSAASAQDNTVGLKSSLLSVGNLLGILQHNPDDWFASDDEDGFSDEDVAKIENLIAERMEAKDNKNYARSDDIRYELLSMGVAIKDTREGTTWEQV